MKNSIALVSLFSVAAGLMAQGTRQWTQSRYDEFEKGKPAGVAIRNDGQLSPAPASSQVFTSDGNYVWSATSDKAGNVYLGTGAVSGGTATVLKVDAQGKSTRLMETKELAVQALRSTPDGKLYAATSPDGKVYRIDGANQSTVVFDPSAVAEKPKYLWDLAVSAKGELYIATGAPAVIYKIAPGSKPEVVLKSGDQHIRCLIFANDGTLFAGSDGAGVIYRIRPNEKPFAIYAAPRHEITALALDAQGNLYAAGVGDKRPPQLPPLPVQGNPSVSITFLNPGSANAATNNQLIPEGSEIYQIAVDGTPQRLVAFKEDVVYALAFQSGRLLAATGNRGRIYAVDTATPGRFTDLVHLDASQAMSFAAAPGNGLFVATSNSGRLFRLEDKPAANATYLSDVFDAGIFSQWGRAEVRGAAGVDLYARSGNVENPEIEWSPWAKVTPNVGAIGAPSARYVQWKAMIAPGATLDAVSLNYLPKNLPPVIDDLIVVPGTRANIPPPSPTVQPAQIAFPAPASNPGFALPAEGNAPLQGQKDKNAVTARWAAHDDNGDDLMYAVYYRGDGETNWHLLKDRISDKFLSWDASLLPDGGYTIRVVASDGPEHVAADTLSSERVSPRFEVDTTPPMPGKLTATAANGQIHATLDVTDTTSPISHAEYSLDAGPWQYLEPASKLSDSLTEHYDFSVPIKPLEGAAAATEHLLAVRIYDRWENVVTTKTVIR